MIFRSLARLGGTQLLGAFRVVLCCCGTVPGAVGVWCGRVYHCQLRLSRWTASL